MNIVLLSGGSGKRLWPLSNDIRSKQFINIFKSKNKTYESMVQRVFGQIKRVDNDAEITIATSKSQVSTLHHQLGDDISICVEPTRRDTFPAIALVATYLHDVKHVSENKAVVVCPVDPYVEDEYFGALKVLETLAENGSSNLVLMGIEPTYPSEKYGYIMPENDSTISKVDSFKEKPNEETAKKYIEQGALWNSGVFAFKLKYLLNKAHELIDFVDYEDLYNKYAQLEKISFDYAVVEKESDISVMRFGGEWKDLGTWNTLTESMEENIIGRGILDETNSDVNIINELNIPILAMGLKDVVISASPDGILVSNKERSSQMKPYVEKIKQRVMYAEKSWGKFQVIDVEDKSLTILVSLNANHSMNYHSHEHRQETWTIVSGEGSVLLDGVERKVTVGDVISIEAGVKHTLKAITELKAIEVQMGKNISVKDKIKYQLIK